MKKFLHQKGSRSVGRVSSPPGTDSLGWGRNDSIQPGLEKAFSKSKNSGRSFGALFLFRGRGDYKNQELEKAGRTADFLELGELLTRDALVREESCGCHFREEHQTPENEARRKMKSFPMSRPGNGREPLDGKSGGSLLPFIVSPPPAEAISNRS